MHLAGAARTVEGDPAASGACVSQLTAPPETQGTMTRTVCLKSTPVEARPAATSGDRAPISLPPDVHRERRET